MVNELITLARRVLSQPVRTNEDMLARMALGAAAASADDETFDKIYEMINGASQKG